MYAEFNRLKTIELDKIFLVVFPGKRTKNKLTPVAVAVIKRRLSLATFYMRVLIASTIVAILFSILFSGTDSEFLNLFWSTSITGGGRLPVSLSGLFIRSQDAASAR